MGCRRLARDRRPERPESLETASDTREKRPWQTNAPSLESASLRSFAVGSIACSLKMSLYQGVSLPTRLQSADVGVGVPRSLDQLAPGREQLRAFRIDPWKEAR